MIGWLKTTKTNTEDKSTTPVTGLFLPIVVSFLVLMTPLFAEAQTPDIPIGPNGLPSFDAVATDYLNNNTLAPAEPVDFTLPDGTVIDVTNGNKADSPGQAELGPLMSLFWNVVSGLLYIFFVAIPVTFASLAGMVLNGSVNYFVIDMGAVINTQTGIGFAINNLWQVIRDTMNILFIFGLIYIGIKTILDSEDSGTRKTLGYLIAAALFINFSLFIVKAIIDFSNILAVQIAKLMSVQPMADSVGLFTYSGLSGAFFHTIGLQTIITNIDSLRDASSASTSWEQAITLGALMFMTLIFFIVLTVVFLAGAFMLLSRFIALIIYMIFSPIMFLGWILPNFAGYSKNWFKGFIEKAFFAPLFLFMLYLALVSSQQFRAYTAVKSDFQSAVLGDAGAFGIVMVYIFATGMLVAAIVVAQKLSIAGADTSMGVLKGMRNNVQGYMGRNFIGRPANTLVKFMDKQGDTKVGRALGGIKTVANAATLGALGTGSVRSTLDSARKSKFGSSQSLEDIKKSESSLKKEQSLAYTASQLKEKIQLGTLSGASEESRIQMERAIADASQKQLEELGASTLSTESVAGSLSQSQFESIMKSDEFSDTEKGKIAMARNKSVTERLSEKDENGNVKEGGRVKVEDASGGQLAALGAEYLSNGENAVWLGEKQMDELEKKFTETEFGRIKTARKKALITVAETGKKGKFEIKDMLKKKPGELAKLPAEVLTNPNVAKRLSTDTLAKIVMDGTQNHETQVAIKAAILKDSDEPLMVEGLGAVAMISGAPQAEWFKTTIGKQFGANV